MKRYVVALLVVLTLGLESAWGAVSISSWPDIPENGSGVGVVGLTFTEDFSDTTSGASFVMGSRPNPTNSNGYNFDFLCDSALDERCRSSNGRAEMLLPHCSIDDSSACVEKLFIERDEVLIEGVFDRMVASKKMIGNPSLGIPNGYNSSLWTIPNVQHEGGEATYAVYANYRASLTGFLESFRVSVNPYVLKRSSNYRENGYSESSSGDGGQRIVGTNGANGCVWTEDGICGFPANFPKDVKVGVVLRVSKEVKGWLNGRVQKPGIKFSEVDTTLNRVEVVGLPTLVQKVYGKTLIATGDKEVVDSLRYFGWDEKQQYLGTGMADSNRAIPLFELWRQYIPDRADSLRSYWSFSVARSSSERCFSQTPGIVGIVTTNSVVYEPDAPRFSEGELRYKVAGVPLTPSGERFPGSYDLVIDSKVARCLYGFTNAPIKASVSISAEDGARSIETVATGEKDGWFSLGAYGFGFSSPTIKVQLSQEAPTPSPSSTPSSTPSTPVTSSKPQGNQMNAAAKPTKQKLTCVKGTKSKKVSGKKCPKGYKKA